MELTLPLLGDVMTEGTLAKWLQADGAEVKAGEPLYELETDKVTLTVDAPESGTLQRVVAEGETVPVGAVVGRLTSDATSPTVAAPKRPERLETGAERPVGIRAEPRAETGPVRPVASGAEQPVETRVERRAEPREVRPVATGAERPEEIRVERAETGEARPVATRAERPAQTRVERRAETGEVRPVAPLAERPAQTGVERRAETGEARPAASGEVRATPAARAAARRLGVDLRDIANGRRLREADVLAAAASTRDGTSLTGRRKAIAERMRASLAHTAQVTISLEVDVTEALRLREQLKQLLPEEARPSITDVVIRATVLALREHPALNATLRDGHLEIRQEIHMGLAVDADDGLIVPVLRDAHALDLMGLAQKTRALSQRARSNALGLEDVQGGTFTVTSLGPLGVDFFTPIINPPQVAILGIGRVFTKLRLTDGRVEERQCMYLNLSFDHQVIDGAPAARFLQSVKTALELPAALLVGTTR